MERHKFKKVSHFKYLGSKITQDNDLNMEVGTRIPMGNRCYLILWLNKHVWLKSLMKKIQNSIFHDPEKTNSIIWF